MGSGAALSVNAGRTRMLSEMVRPDFATRSSKTGYVPQRASVVELGTEHGVSCTVGRGAIASRGVGVAQATAPITARPPNHARRIARRRVLRQRMRVSMLCAV
jgi:hypothetical protein